MQIEDLLNKQEIQELCWHGHVKFDFFNTGVKEIEREYESYKSDFVLIYFTKNNKTYRLRCEQERSSEWYFDCATIVEVEKVEVLSYVWKEVK
jgi:hypothetical protein